MRTAPRAGRSNPAGALSYRAGAGAFANTSPADLDNTRATWPSMSPRLQKRQWQGLFINGERDRRFAVPRCWCAESAAIRSPSAEVLELVVTAVYFYTAVYKPGLQTAISVEFWRKFPECGGLPEGVYVFPGLRQFTKSARFSLLEQENTGNFVFFGLKGQKYAGKIPKIAQVFSGNS